MRAVRLASAFRGLARRSASLPRAAALQSSNGVNVAAGSPSHGPAALTCPDVQPFSSSCPAQDFERQKAAGVATALEGKLTRDLLHDLHGFWFEHCKGDEAVILPGQEENKRWYAGGSAFDDLCIKRYGPTLEGIRASGVTSGAEILAIAKPQAPSDWLALVLLLDQIPRNSYRGSASAIVFNFFDPIARDVATAAIERGITELPEIRWRLGYRVWFYLPLMHSEDLAMHDLAVQQYGGVVKDFEGLLKRNDDPTQWDEYRQRAAAVVRANEEAAMKTAKVGADFEKRHQVIIQRFGRYPHRNEALGRQPTAEEEEYLKNGGERF